MKMCKCITRVTGVYVEACYANKLRYATMRETGKLYAKPPMLTTFGNQLLDQYGGTATLH